MGYFPTYSLGNLNAAQLMRRAQTDCPTLETELARGEYGTLLGWLREKVHRQGMRHHPQELMRTVTGEGTKTDAHLAALRKKYGVTA